jgi:uncharacterized membrane protein YccC
MDTSVALPRPDGKIADAFRAAGPPLLFGIRFWASVCLALFVAFSLDLDNPFWAGTSAAVVCQPQLGASLRKGWFRMIGTVIGAAMIVVLAAWFPQDRVGFLALLALWCAICAFLATVLRNFASYAAALAGYTAAIVAANTLGATGGVSPDVFMQAVFRASEICVGIACAGIVLAGTDLGGAQRRLAASLADLATAVAGGFARTLATAGTQQSNAQTERRELVRRVVALEPAVDEALGESSHVRYHAARLQIAVQGLLRALDGWRGIATHLNRAPDGIERQSAQTVLRDIPSALRSAQEAGAASRWIADPMALRAACAAAAHKLLALSARSPSLRLLADESAKVLDGLVRLFDGLALLVDAPHRPAFDHRGARQSVPDWLPALLNAARAFVTIAAVELFWVATAWPNGTLALVFSAVVLLLLAPRGDLAYGGALALAVGTTIAVVFAAIIKFAVLPAFDTFPAFCLALGLVLVPAGFARAWSRQPAAIAVFTAMGVNVMPLLSPTNPMSYDTTQFYNTALAIVVGCSVGPLAFRLLPPLSPALRTRRLLALTLRDLRRAVALPPARLEDWEGLMYGRLAALPDQAEPLQRAQLLAALSVGSEIFQLRHLTSRVGAAAELEAALAALAQGNSAIAVARLRQLDRQLAFAPDAGADEATALRVRARILVLGEALSEHASYFDGGGRA